MDCEEFWRKWLSWACGLLGVFGLAMVLSSNWAWFQMLFNSPSFVLPFWPDGEVPAGARAFQHWIYGLLGAVMAGWAVTLWFLSRELTGENLQALIQATFWGLMVWFVLDSAISLIDGVWLNVGLNFSLLLIFLLPLWKLKKSA